MMTPDKWAAENRTYPETAAVPGRRDPHLTPYIVEPERLIVSGKYKRIVMVMGAQSGKTEMMLDIAGQRLDQRPAPILYVGPNKQFLTEQFEPRVMALLDEAPTLMAKVARGKRMTRTRKVVAGVPFRLAHSGSSTALKSDPAALALVDEYDEMIANVKGQGGPLGLVERRGDTYADFVCVVTSTPKKGRIEAVVDPTSGLIFWDVAVADDIESPIWSLWQQGTRHHWCWPCPHCGDYFVPRFDRLRGWSTTSTPVEAMRNAFLECPSCHGVIEEKHKAVMNERGRYVAPGQSVDKAGNIHGTFRESRALTLWVSGLASPFVSFGERVATYLEAVASGDDAEIQAAVNGGFGELYSSGAGDVPEWAAIKEKSRLSSYRRGEVPDGVMHLVLTVDVQKQSLPWVLRGWGARATSWMIDYGYLRGDTAEEEIWDHLAMLCRSDFEGVPVRTTLIDSGFRPGKVDTLPLNRVYEFCRAMGRSVRATKGSSSPMRTPLIFTKVEVNRAGKASKFGLDLIRLDTDHWKSWVHERIIWREDRPGAWMVPQNVDDDYCHQVVGEARVKSPTGRVEWVQRGRHNHFLDCEAMQAAAGYLLNVQRVPLPKLKDGATHSAGRKPTTQDEVVKTAPPTPPPPPPTPTQQSSQEANKQPQRGSRLARRRSVFRSNFLGP